MIEVVVILVALTLLNQKRTIPAVGIPGSPVSPLSNAALQQLLGKQQQQPSTGKASTGGSMGGGGFGGGGSPGGAGRSAGNFPPTGWDPLDPLSQLIQPASYSDPNLQAYLDAYNAYYGADPAAPTGASGAIGSVPGYGAPGDMGTAEAGIYQDSTLSGILQAPVGDVTLAPQPDTTGDTSSSAFASDGWGSPSQTDTGVASYDPALDPNSYLDSYTFGGNDPLSFDPSAYYDSGNGYGGDPYAEI